MNGAGEIIQFRNMNGVKFLVSVQVVLILPAHRIPKFAYPQVFAQCILVGLSGFGVIVDTIIKEQARLVTVG